MHPSPHTLQDTFVTIAVTAIEVLLKSTPGLPAGGTRPSGLGAVTSPLLQHHTEWCRLPRNLCSTHSPHPAGPRPVTHALAVYIVLPFPACHNVGSLSDWHLPLRQ